MKFAHELTISFNTENISHVQVDSLSFKVRHGNGAR